MQLEIEGNKMIEYLIIKNKEPVNIDPVPTPEPGLKYLTK